MSLAAHLNKDLNDFPSCLRSVAEQVETRLDALLPQVTSSFYGDTVADAERLTDQHMLNLLHLQEIEQELAGIVVVALLLSDPT